MFCPKCGAEAPEEAKFCGSCGAKFPGEVAGKCPSCGHQNERNAKFCLKCGTELPKVDSPDMALDVSSAISKVVESVPSLPSMPSSIASPDNKRLIFIGIEVALLVALLFIPWIHVNLYFMGSQSLTLFSIFTQLMNMGQALGATMENGGELYTVAFAALVVLIACGVLLVVDLKQDLTGGKTEHHSFQCASGCSALIALLVYFVNAAIVESARGTEYGAVASAVAQVLSVSMGTWITLALGIFGSYFSGKTS